MRFECKTEILTSLIGRDKMRLKDLDRHLKDSGDQGWELISPTAV